MVVVGTGTNDDNIAGGGHAINSGMIGSAGNNGDGGVGSIGMWISSVDMAGGLTESNVIAEYPKTLQMVNATGGGYAFVVATNVLGN